MTGLLFLLAVSINAQVSYSPQPINFGSVKLGATSAVLSSTLTNTGTDTLRFTGGSSMAGSPAFQYVTDNCTPRPPGTSCVLQYRFAPKSVGSLTGANLVGTNHGFFPLNFTGIGVDTVTAPPPPPQSVVAGIGFGTSGVGLFPKDRYYVAAVPRDELGNALGAAVTWRLTDTTLLKLAQVVKDFTQVAELYVPPRTAQDTARDTVIATAGLHTARFVVKILPAAPSPPPVPPVFGVRASWLSMFLVGCTATPGTPCTRGPLPVLADSDGHAIASVTVTATFTAP